MNCIDFRRDALVQPLRLGDEARAHALTCAACTEFIERQRQVDAELLEALSVPVPDGLADRIVLARGIRNRKPRWVWAAAASILIAAGAALLIPPYVAGNALAHEAIAHVKEEPQSFVQVSAHAPDHLAKELAVQEIGRAHV